MNEEKHDGLIYRRAGIEDIYELRFAVLRPRQVPMKLHFPGDGDLPPATWHFGAFEKANGNAGGNDGGKNVGCLTLFMSAWENQPAYQLRGMAVAEEWRGRGMGAALLQKAEEVVNAESADAPRTWWCNARTEAIGFYERQGWRVASEEFMIEHVGPHRKMVKELRAQP